MKSVFAAALLSAFCITPAISQINTWVTDDNGSGIVRVEEFNAAGSYLNQFIISGSSRFQYGATAMAVAPNGNAYITDGFNKNISEFSATGAFVGAFGGWGTANGQFTGVSGIAAAASGNVWVVDSGNNRVQEFSSSGTYIAQFGTYGSGNGQFLGPGPIAIDGTGNIWVIDGNGSVPVRVEEFTSSGAYVNQFTISGSGRFPNGAVGIAISSNGTFYITDIGNKNVSEFTNSGTFVRSFGGWGTGNGQFTGVQGVAVDANSNVWVVDSGNDRVQEFDSNGNYLSQFGGVGSGNGQFFNAGAIVTNVGTAAPSTLVLAPAVASPYSTGTAQSFTASLQDPSGAPEAGVAVNFVIAGVNPGLAQLVTDDNGLANYTYTGTSSGTDNIQASASPNGQLVSSNTVSATWIPPIAPTGQFSLTLTPSGATPTLGLAGLCGAFTDSSGAVIEAVSIGASQRVFIVPAGATQLQLGVDDDVYSDEHGPGFVVAVNGVPVTVAANSMPWLWAPGGLNSTYPFGIRDGSNPTIGATNLVPGQGVVVAYQSGTVSPGGSLPQVDANGLQDMITGAHLGSSGSYAPTYYMFDLSDPINRTIVFTAILEDGSGNPVASSPVAFTVTGANAQQLSATTDAHGDASISYVGQTAGTDIVSAQASPAEGGTVTSGTTTMVWNPVPNSGLTGTLQLSPSSVSSATVGGQDVFSVLVRDPLGNPLPGVGVVLSISGADIIQLQGVSDTNGIVVLTYHNVNVGVSTVQAIGLIGGTLAYSNRVSTTWTSAGSGGGGSGGGGSGAIINLSIQANPTVTLPNALQLNATVTDTSLPAGTSPTLTWSQLNGPGSSTFANAAQATTSVTFSAPGNYILQLNASDGTNTATSQIQVAVNSSAGTQGWIGSPAYGSTVSGVVPITVASGVSIASGQLIYYSASDPYATNPTVLNANVSGTGQIGTFDTTLLANGSYYIQLQATNSAGQSQYSVALVTVAGQYKPGRVTTTVTDLVIPATGLAISIQRQYDSLNAGTSSDFGYGWSLGTNVNLTVDPSYNVTFTLAGQRKTFFFTPQFFLFFLGDVAAYTPEPGLSGSLTAQEDSLNCPFGYVAPNGSLWQCLTGDLYSPSAYIYTDPSGTQYTISASGNLQSIKDIGGNTLTVTPAGITSSTGLSVPFTRDSSGRITQITDPRGNAYIYTYDSSGNLATVKYPGITQTSTYTYDANHHYLSGTDFRGDQLPTTTYDASGRLQSVTDALGETTSYAYNTVTNTTTVTYPPDANNLVGKSTLVYDSYGMLLSSTDPLGLTTTNTYDPNHNLITVTDPLGHTNSYTYDALGNRTSATYPKTTTSTNTTSTTTYNQYSEPISSTDELGNSRAYNYDSNFWPASVTDGIGTLMSSIFNANGTMQAGAIGYDITQQPSRASQFSYDAYGNLASKTDALGRVTSYTYNALGQKASMVEPVASGTSTSSATTSYTYDPFGNLTQTAAPLSRTTSSAYDANGNKLSDTDADGNVTTYTYDALNRLVTTTYPTSPATTITNTYDFRGNIITQTDQAGNVTKNQYDVSGRLTSVTKAFGTANAMTTIYAYDNAGRTQSETDSLGHTTTYTYDAAGNLTGVAGVNGNFTYAYDNARNRVSMTDGDSNTTQYQYDARKRLVQTIYPTSPATMVTNTYDGPGNLTSVTDQAGNVVNYAYDAANQLQTVVQANSPNTGQNTNTYGYDPLGDLSSSSDANTHITNSGYDLLGELKTKTLPDGSLSETRGYDAAGNLTSLTHFNGKTTTYAHDSLNRLITRTPDPSLGEATVSFTYTATGKRATMTDANGTTTYTYDSADRLITKATPAGTLNYTYDAAGHVASIASSNTNGASMSYTYDSLNRLSTVVDNRMSSGLNTTTYTYDPASNLATATYPNGLVSTFTYDSLNRLTAMSTPPVSSYGYTLGATGNRTSATEQSGRALNWSYDGIYRLTSETIASDPAGGNGSTGYVLDPVGNRSSDTSTIPSISSVASSFNADDEMAAETYDSNGNTTATGGKTFTYDSENRLTTMNGSAVSIVYDGDGNRVAKTVGGVTTRYLVDDLNPTGYAQVIEEVVNGAVSREYTYGLQRISENQVISSAWTPSFYGYDGGGSVRQLTNSAGAVTDTYEYDAYGNKWTVNGTTPNDYLYRGEQYDPDLGLYYLRARYMNPVTGRFMSRDPNDPQPIDPDHQLYDAEVAPIDLKALHKYLYAGGDPVNTIDPRGRAGEAEDAGANLESVEEAIDNLKSIEKAQQRVRSGADGGKRIIDVIQKSYDKVDNLLDDIVRGKIDPGDL